MSQIQASPFGPLHFYDAPEVALTQIMDDEATFGSFVNTFFSPDTLSPIERDSYADRMKEQLGYDKKGVGSALVDVATNPLVYLAFLFTPAGLRMGGQGRLFAQNIKNSLSALILRNGRELMHGTAGAEGISQMQRVARRLSQETASIVDPHLAKYLEARGITYEQYRDPTRIKDLALRQEVQHDLDLLHIKLSGMDKAEEITRTNYIQKFTNMDGVEVDIDKAKELHKIYAKAGGDIVESADGELFRVKRGVDDIIVIDEDTTSAALFDFSKVGGL